MIVEWTRDEEAKYQASLVAREVGGEMFSEPSIESMRKKNESTSEALMPKSPRSRSRSGSSRGSKRTPSPEKAKKKDKGPFASLLFPFNLLILQYCFICKYFQIKIIRLCFF